MDGEIWAALVLAGGTLFVAIFNRITIKRGIQTNKNDHDDVFGVVKEILHEVNYVREDQRIVHGELTVLRENQGTMQNRLDQVEVSLLKGV